jgi:hypothetical protein
MISEARLLSLTDAVGNANPVADISPKQQAGIPAFQVHRWLSVFFRLQARIAEWRAGI